MKIDTNDLISVTDASQAGVSKLVSNASCGRPQVVLRNNKPVAAVVGIDILDRLQRLDDIEEDLLLLSVALIRSTSDTGRRYSLDEVADELGIDLDELGDDEENDTE